MADTKHQCRYCAWCIFTINNDWWCDEKYEYIEKPKSPNRCEKWLFNEIAADNLNKKYKPRKKSKFKQLRLFDKEGNPNV